jgi:hypothetical protein
MINNFARANRRVAKRRTFDERKLQSADHTSPMAIPMYQLSRGSVERSGQRVVSSRTRICS